MLIGNRDHFAFDLEPVSPSWDRRYAPEAAAWAGLAIWIAGQNLCAHIREGEDELRERLFVPLGPLADWFASSYLALTLEERAPLLPTSQALHDLVHDWAGPPPREIDEDAWLDAREAFWSRHFLSAGAEGARLPNLAILREDDRLFAWWRPPCFLGEPRVTMFHRVGEASLRWTEFSEVLARFVSFVAVTFRDAGLQHVYSWAQSGSLLDIAASDEDKIGLFCARSPEELASLLGVAPSTLRTVLGFGESVADPATSPACQIIRDLPPWPSLGVGSEILDLVSMIRAAPSSKSSTWRRLRDVSLDAARAGRTPEHEGQLAAQTLREELGLDGQPIQDMDALIRRFDLLERPTELATHGERMIVASVADRRPMLSIFSTPRTKINWGRRFEQARATGHVMLDPEREGVVGAASSSYAQELRRRRSGAFAAELLLPDSALERLSANRRDGAAEREVFARILADYGVGARTAAHQLNNHGWLSGRHVLEELIESFAARES